MGKSKIKEQPETAGFPDHLIDALVKGVRTEGDLFGENGILKQITKRLVERALVAEMSHHLGYEKHAVEGNNSGNSRNGKTTKTLTGEIGEVEIEIPRDRNGDFEPTIVRKHQRRLGRIEDQILSMYARGMTTRDIQGHLKDIYGADVSPDLISSVTDSVLEEVTEWQNRPLDPLYLIVWLDAIFIKIRDEGHVRKKAVYIAIGLNTEGLKEVLGLWVEQTEGAKFWLKVIAEIKARGVDDILIAAIDGLKGFPEAIESVYPDAQIQLCLVHMVRNSLRYVSFKDRKHVAADLKTVYRAPNVEQAEKALDAFEKEWGEKFPLIGKSWRTHWEFLIPFFAYPSPIRRAMYTTNTIESLNFSLKKAVKNRSSFPTDEAAVKLLYMALKNIKRRWTMPIKDWGSAINQFSIIFGDRLSLKL